MPTTTTTRNAERANTNRAWRAITTLIAATTFSQAIFAGLLLSAASWGRAAHEVLAYALVLTSLVAGLTAAITLRHRPTGRRLATALVVLGIVLVVQTGLGLSGSHGVRTMFLHVPLGVAVVGLSLRPVRLARQLVVATDPGTARPTTAETRRP